jgi:hypothetical protein
MVLNSIGNSPLTLLTFLIFLNLNPSNGSCISLRK